MQIDFTSRKFQIFLAELGCSICFWDPLSYRQPTNSRVIFQERQIIPKIHIYFSGGIITTQNTRKAPKRQIRSNLSLPPAKMPPSGIRSLHFLWSFEFWNLGGLLFGFEAFGEGIRGLLQFGCNMGRLSVKNDSSIGKGLRKIFAKMINLGWLYFGCWIRNFLNSVSNLDRKEKLQR